MDRNTERRSKSNLCEILLNRYESSFHRNKSDFLSFSIENFVLPVSRNTPLLYTIYD